MNPLIGMPQGAEWLVILVIVVLVFGAAKLPDLARNSGQALRIFKAETKGLRDDDDDDAKDKKKKKAKTELPTTATEEIPVKPDVVAVKPDVVAVKPDVATETDVVAETDPPKS